MSDIKGMNGIELVYAVLYDSTIVLKSFCDTVLIATAIVVCLSVEISFVVVVREPSCVFGYWSLV